MRHVLPFALLCLVGCRPAPTPPAEAAPPPEYEAPPAASTVESPAPPPIESDAAASGETQVACLGTAAAPKNALFGYPKIDISRLSLEHVDPGGWNTEGIVLDHFEPKPCPPRAHCKPQPPSYLVLASEVSDEEQSIPLETPAPKQFPIGKRLAVSIVLCGPGYYRSALNQAQLLAAVAK